MFKKSLMIVSIVSLLSFALAGCNTVAGFGQDLSKGGNSLTKAADRNK